MPSNLKGELSQTVNFDQFFTRKHQINIHKRKCLQSDSILAVENLFPTHVYILAMCSVYWGYYCSRMGITDVDNSD